MNATNVLLAAFGMLMASHELPAAEPPRSPVVAHRGLLLQAPENTLANFRTCLELRIGFEFDVQKTKDGQLVCIHDENVKRTTDGMGLVADLTLAEIRRLDAGHWFDAKYAGEKVPTVDEVFKLLAEYARHEVSIAVDLKAADVEGGTVQLAEKHGVLHRLVFIGNTIENSDVRDRIKKASVKAQTSVVANDAGEFKSALEAKNGDWVYFRYLPSKEEMAAIGEAGKRSFIAGKTVAGNVPDNWKKALGAGIDGILTDYPLELRTLAKSAR